MKSKSIEEIEQEMYEALMREVPDLQPFVARGLAKTAADNFRNHQIAGLTPAPKNENDQQNS